MYSVETILYLLLLKIKYTSKIILLRGNHEHKYANLNVEKWHRTMDSIVKSPKSMETRIAINIC